MEDKTLKQLKTRPTYGAYYFAGWYYLYRFNSNGSKTAMMDSKGRLISSKESTLINNMAAILINKAIKEFELRNK